MGENSHIHDKHKPAQTEEVEIVPFARKTNVMLNISNYYDYQSYQLSEAWRTLGTKF